MGKRGIAAEKIAERPWEPFTNVATALERPHLTYMVDAGLSFNWTPLLRPLEEGSIEVVVLSSQPLPAPVSSRIPTFRTGFLTEHEVFQVLAEHFPKLTPRPILARIAAGSLSGVEALAVTAKTFETFDKALVENRMPDFRHVDPLSLVYCLRDLCQAILGMPSLPFSEAARRAISIGTASALLSLPVPTTKHEARNLLALFFQQRRG